MINKIFKLEENNTNIKTEITAGLTTFFTMSYLFVISPKLLLFAGLDFETSISVTALVVFIGSLLMGLYANKPYAVAPFLGETAFIAYTLTGTLGLSIKSALAAISFCGIILLLMTLFNFRIWIIKQIPDTIKISFCTGLGLFFIYIAMKDIGIIKNFFEFGDFTSINVLLGLFCTLLMITLIKKGVKAAILISIAITTIIGIIAGDISITNGIISTPSGISSSLLCADFSSIFNKNFIPILFVIFLIINIDTSGALIALKYNCTDKLQENEKNTKKAMITDSLMVIIAPLLGTTTPGAYIDSMTGISAGGRTGLTSVTVGVLFLLGLIFTPLIMIIPAYAYAPALLYIGVLMTCSVKQIDFNDITEFFPAIFIIAAMIFTGNIGSGIITGFIVYPALKLLTGQKNKTNITSWVLFVLSIIYFIIYPH